MSPDERTSDRLSAFLDGECTDIERTEIETALQTDPAAREELEEIRTTRDLLRGLPRPELSDDDLDALITAVAAAPLEPPTRATRRTGRVSRVVAGAAAAVAVAAAVVAVAVVPSRSHVTPPVGSLVDTHAAQAGLVGEPISQLAPIVVPAGFSR